MDERGLLPVRVLCGNLADLFFNISPDFLKEFENEVYNGLSDKIVYSIQTEYIRDVAQLNNQQQIVLYENFNQYLWSMTYALLVLFDKGVHAPRLNGEFSGAFADTPEVAEAWDLFQAALYLKKGYNREIFYHLPNPELNNGEEYILKANAVYLAALNFILLHEFGHQYYGHYSYFEPGDQAKQDEHLADDFAINKISGHFNSNNGKTLKAGILVGTLSLLFLRKTLGGGASHPNLDVRLKVIIEKLELEELDNLWGVAGLAISLWSNEFGHDVQIPPVGETYKELFYEILEDLPRFQ
ncbi:MAG TPA: phage exclusion protein Lit family protein [Pedobacter sp.]|nr:phage exclusion protein Lit family protein [Pedobacter sp.]